MNHSMVGEAAAWLVVALNAKVMLVNNWLESFPGMKPMFDAMVRTGHAISDLGQ
ncbi:MULTISPECIES: hypothetical protein [unclassified Janthinobacterium]|uniref:hypothetical protein n=1 Tax=unclassified Janthinobacterium TaxID=2610881 RepID=UPI0016166DBB|nr:MULTISPECIES: hypothetical protein [unclassified Janthinobacterium]MBB5371413.1 hypothetical protein [Janthinobacterium sp. K2C7]MBB5384219.1 hypothetical protein [Janthinobacterium sp. K2Li3]MBB5389494.1 hypothetical protein [Janthinobacterium sp. K2E3]